MSERPMHVALLVFPSRFSRPRAVRHRRRRRAAADLEPHVGGAGGAGARRHQRRKASRAHSRRRRVVRRQRRPEHGRAVRRSGVLPRQAEARAFHERDVIKAADGFGFHPSMVGFERLYKDGMLGVVHGCGYDHPSLSHFSSMGFWHTGVPNGGESLGWLGRLADHTYDATTRNMIVNLGNSQSLAVRSAQHSPLVFDDPARFRRDGTDDEKQVLAGIEPAADHDQRRRSNSWRRRRRTRPRAPTSCARPPRAIARRWTTAWAAASAATCSASRR